MGSCCLSLNSKEGFREEQLDYLKDKFDILSQDAVLLEGKFADAFRCSLKEARAAVKWMDIEGKGKIHEYDFICAAASLVQTPLDRKSDILFEIYSKSIADDDVSRDELLLFTRTAFLFNEFLEAGEDCASEDLARVLQGREPEAPLEERDKALLKEKEKKIAELNKERFERWDTNHNNQISKGEFDEILRKDPLYRKWMYNMGFLTQREIEGDYDEYDDELTEALVAAHRKEDNRAESRKLGADMVAEEDDEGCYSIEELVGDEGGAVQAWKGQIKTMEPSSFSRIKQTAPDQTLDMEYVFGYRCYDTHDNLKYNPNGHAVYHTAAVGIVLDPAANKQVFNVEHNDDITCIDVYGSLAATGQMGDKPLLIVWDCVTGLTKFRFKGELRKSIANVTFSPNGELLAANSNDDDHTLAVYSMRQAEEGEKNRKVSALVCAGKMSKSVVLCLRFSKDGEYIVAGCPKEVLFVSMKGGVKVVKGSFGKAAKSSAICAAFLSESLLTGMGSGQLLVWKGSSCSQVVGVHESTVSALCERKDREGVVSGTLKGVVRVFSRKLEVEKEVRLTQVLQSNLFKVIALCQNGRGDLLVGLRGGEIYQLSGKEDKPALLMEGHFDKELWGLATHPQKQQAYSAGEDGLLFHWDLLANKSIRKKRMGGALRCVDVDPSGKVLAVGFRNGVVSILEAGSLERINQIKVHKNPDKEVCSLVRFSPTGNQLAVGYCPPVSKVYLYDMANLKAFKVCRGSPSRIHQLDYSEGATEIMVNNTSYEVLFYNAVSGEQIKSGSRLKDEPWATFSCGHAWATQGVWPPCSDGTDVNSLARSHNRKVLVTADDFSKVKLFRYPAYEPNQPYGQFKGHSSHVTSVHFTNKDNFVVSAGGLEKSIIKWKYSGSEYVPELDDEEEDEPVGAGEYQLQDEQGDRAMAVVPNVGQVLASTPEWYKPNPKAFNVLPEETLLLKHAYGLRNQYINDEIRNQVRYAAGEEEVVFPTACLGVRMHKKNLQQEFFNQHREDIVSFDVDCTGTVAATGQMAEKNKNKPTKKIVDVIVWEIGTMAKLARFSGFHVAAVILVSFSPSGKLLLTAGQDQNHSVAVYNWRQGAMLWSSKTSKGKLNACAWLNDTDLLTCGVTEARFWTGQKGRLGKLPGKWDPMTSAFCLDKSFVTGSVSGKIYPWSGGSAGKPIQAHKGKVQCFAKMESMLLSGGDDGIIYSWVLAKGSLTPGTFSFIHKDTLYDKGILSLQAGKSGLLVGTKGSQIFQIVGKRSQFILHAHEKGQLWGCSASPSGYLFATAGDDKTVRVWSVLDRNMKSGSKYLGGQVRAVDWGPQDTIVAGDEQGTVYLLNPQSEVLFQNGYKLKSPMEIIKFSPDGSQVSYGCHRYQVKGTLGKIEVIEVEGKKLGKSRLTEVPFSSAILNIDWARDGSLMQVVSQAYELRFISLANYKDVAASSVRNTDWATTTCKFGFPVMGIFRTVNFSDLHSVCSSRSRRLIATGNNDQVVRLFKYPCVVPGQVCREYPAHSSHITRVVFSYDDHYLFTVGGNDRTALVWEVIGTKFTQEDRSALEEDFEIQVPKERYSKEVEKETDAFDYETDTGDQFLAIKPWLGAIKPPDDSYKKSTFAAPEVGIKLQYCHGYRSKDCRNNLKYLSQDRVVYHAAALGIVHDLKTNTQSFFDLHSDDILSLALSSDRTKVATGQLGPKPMLYVWHPETKEVIAKWKAPVLKGICAVAFSPNDALIACAAIDDEHRVAVLNLGSGLVISEKGDRHVILQAIWTSNSSFTTVGIKHLKSWTVGTRLAAAAGQFGSNCNQLVCGTMVDDLLVTGAGNGALLLWKGASPSGKQVFLQSPEERKPIDCLSFLHDTLVVGTKGGKIYFLKKDLEVQASLVLGESLKGKSRLPLPRAVDSLNPRKMLVGTLGSEVFELSIPEGMGSSSVKGFKVVVQGHFSPNQNWTNQVWGLAVSPDGKSFYTCSDDGTLRQFNMLDRRQVAVTSLNFNKEATSREYNELDPKLMLPRAQSGDLQKAAKGRCIGVNQKDGTVVVGCVDGTIRGLSKDLTPQFLLKDSSMQISQVKFNNLGQDLVAVSHDSKIYLYSWKNGQPRLKVKPVKKHSSAVLHFDFSKDGGFIHSTCRSYELLFFDVESGRQVTGGATMFRNEDWQNWTVPLGWPVQGIWPECADGTDINSVDRSHKVCPGTDYRLLATGDDWGKVNVLRYPSLKKSSKAVVGRGHSSHVTNVRWSLDDDRILSAGGEDQCVLQWVVKPLSK